MHRFLSNAQRNDFDRNIAVYAPTNKQSAGQLQLHKQHKIHRNVPIAVSVSL